MFNAVLKRDLLAVLRQRNEWLNPLLFYGVVVTLFPLAISPDARFLGTIAPGVLWVAGLLATLLSLDMLFQSDYNDGTLEQLALSPQPLYLAVLAKVLAHWLVTGLPLALLSPVLGIMLALPSQAMAVLVLTLLMGTLTLSLIGAVAAALTVGLRKTGVLLSLLVLPLYIPVLIFATAAVQAAVMGLPVSGYFALLGAIGVLAAVLSPFATAAALRISLS